MPLNPATGASAANAAINAQISTLQSGSPIKSPTDIAKDIAAAYHAYAKNATLLGADMSQGGNVALLEAAFISNNTTAMANQIAQGICDYWSSFVTIGVPAHGGTSVVSIAVNGTSVLAAMQSAVLSLITNTQKNDGWLDFYNATEAVVKTMPCVITELMAGTPPTPVAYPETIN